VSTSQTRPYLDDHEGIGDEGPVLPRPAAHDDVGLGLVATAPIVVPLHPHAALIAAAAGLIHRELQRRTDIAGDLLVVLGRVRHHDDVAVDEFPVALVALGVDEAVELGDREPAGPVGGTRHDALSCGGASGQLPSLTGTAEGGKASAAQTLPDDALGRAARHPI
jgi:hypothetical protein